jgi:hypothetical protein
MVCRRRLSDGLCCISFMSCFDKTNERSDHSKMDNFLQSTGDFQLFENNSALWSLLVYYVFMTDLSDQFEYICLIQEGFLLCDG